MHRRHAGQFDLQTCFLQELPDGRFTYILVPLQPPAGDAPQPGVPPLRPLAHQHPPYVVADDHRNAHTRVAHPHVAAGVAGRRPLAPAVVEEQRAATVRAELAARPLRGSLAPCCPGVAHGCGSCPAARSATTATRASATFPIAIFTPALEIGRASCRERV